MERYLIAIGMLLNSVLIVINRFVKELPDWIAIPAYLVGIVLIIAGAYLTKR